MPRPKGSKNKTAQDKVVAIIEAVEKLPLDEKEKAEAIDQLDDLLESPVDESKTDKIFVGYHPITGTEVWQ
jgi:hypothetical protein